MLLPWWRECCDKTSDDLGSKYAATLYFVKCDIKLISTSCPLSQLTVSHHLARLTIGAKDMVGLIYFSFPIITIFIQIVNWKYKSVQQRLHSFLGQWTSFGCFYINNHLCWKKTKANDVSSVAVRRPGHLLMDSCVTIYLLGVMIHGDHGSNLVAWWYQQNEMCPV